MCPGSGAVTSSRTRSSPVWFARSTAIRAASEERRGCGNGDDEEETAEHAKNAELVVEEPYGMPVALSSLWTAKPDDHAQLLHGSDDSCNRHCSIRRHGCSGCDCADRTRRPSVVGCRSEPFGGGASDTAAERAHGRGVELRSQAAAGCDRHVAGPHAGASRGILAPPVGGMASRF